MKMTDDEVMNSLITPLCNVEAWQKKKMQWHNTPIIFNSIIFILPIPLKTRRKPVSFKSAHYEQDMPY